MSVGPGVISTISAGQTSVTNIVNGGILVDYGSAVINSITSGGTFSIEGGGVASVTTISAGGGAVATGTVFAGGLSVSAVIGAGGDLDVNGTAQNTDVSGGVMNVSSGGGATVNIVEAGGSVRVLSGGAVSDTAVQTGGVEYLSGTDISNTVGSGGLIDVYAGGVLSSATVLASGQVNVSGGTIKAATILSNGQVFASAGSLASGTIVSGSGRQTISSGAVASASFLTGLQTSSGGFFGQETVLSGGASVSATVASLGLETVSSGGTATGTILAGSTAEETVYGTAFSTVVSSGGVLFTSSGGIAYGTIVSSGGQIYDEGGTESGTILGMGAYDTVGFPPFGTGSAYATTVNSGGRQFVSAGGTTSLTAINNGGAEIVSSGGQAYGTVLNGVLVITGSSNSATAVLSVTSSGLSVGASVGSGGSIVLNSGGVGSGSVISGTIVRSNNVDYGTAYERVNAGGVANNDFVGSGGAIYVQSGGVTRGAILSGGSSTYSFASYENVVSGGAASGTVLGSGGELNLEGGIATATSLGLGGKIDLVSLAFVSGGSASLDPGTDVLTVMEGTVTSTVSLAGDYAGHTFHLSADLFGTGTIITQDTVPCYCPGTLILTDRGEVAVEQLRIGDRVITLAGQAEPVRWIGRRSYAGRFLAGRRHLYPIAIAAGALGDGLPRRCLRVSPDHAMYLDGVLVPARQLVNGFSIVQEASCAAVEYIHVELARHEVIWAEGSPSETYLDDDSRFLFHNASEFWSLYPDSEATGSFYAPRVDEGYRLEAIRQRIAGYLRAA